MLRVPFHLSFRGLASAMLLLAAGVLPLLGVADRATAAPVLSLSSATNLNTLQVGDMFTVDVSLSGLSGGTSLTLLAGTAQYTGTALSAPTITVGAIVPGGAANPDMSTTPGLNVADGAFQTFSANVADQVSTNGVFFSFQLTALQTGSGSIALTFFDALDALGDPVGITAGPALNFNVSPIGGGGGGGAAPLPAGLLAALVCLPTAVVAKRRIGSRSH